MKKVTRIIGVFAISGAAFFVVTMSSFLVYGAIKGIDPREGGFLFVSPLAMLAMVVAMVSVVYGMLSGLAVNIFWNYATSSTGNLLKLSAVVAGVFASLWMLMLYLDNSPPNSSEGFLRRDNVYMFLIISAVGTASTAIAIAAARRIFQARD